MYEIENRFRTASSGMKH